MAELTGIFDSHAHYDDGRFDVERERLLAGLPDAGISLVCNVAADLDGCATSAALSRAYAFIYCSVGLHPDCAGKTQPGWLEKLEGFLGNPKAVAIGEIGLDYHYLESSKQAQQELFAQQMQLAQRHQLPVIIHSREAMADTLEILRSFPDVTGVVHCFSGSAESATELVRMGYSIGFTGVITFKNAKKARRAAEAVPLSRLLIETDCPYMAPEPWRGRRCDSRMLVSVAQTLADIKGVSPQQLVDAARENACRVYHIPVV